MGKLGDMGTMWEKRGWAGHESGRSQLGTGKSSEGSLPRNKYPLKRGPEKMGRGEMVDEEKRRVT